MKKGSVKQLLGSKQHIVEINKLKEKRRFLLLPDDKLKTFWTIVIVVLMVYTAIFVPFKIAFVEIDSGFLAILDGVVDILFAIDIIVNFLSAVEHPKTGKLITDHKEIAKIYLMRWFWLDFLACFPFQFLSFGDDDDVSSNRGVLRLARLPRLYRLVRLLRMVKMLRVLKTSRTITDLIELL